MEHSDDFDQVLPPPAYSEQEFDQKISLATQLSLAVHQDTHRNRDQPVEDSWEAWDETKFQMAASQMRNLSLQVPDSTAGISSVRPPEGGATADIQPLRIHKKNPSGGRSVAPSGKQRPSWLADAEGSSCEGPSSSVMVPSIAPTYTPSPYPDSAPSSALSPTGLPNPFTNREWGTGSPVPTLPDPYDEENHHPDPKEAAEAPPALIDHALRPPPFSSDSENHSSNFGERPNTQPATAHSVAEFWQTRPTARLPVHVSNHDTNISIMATDQPAGRNLFPHHSQLGGSARSAPASPMYPIPDTHPIVEPRLGLPSQLIPGATRSRSTNSYQNSMLPPQNVPGARINVELSTVYGKCPAVTTSIETRPQQINAAAFYNSAVSAHLYSKQPTSSIEQRRQSHQPTAPTSLHTFQSAPNRYSRASSGFASLHNSYNTSVSLLQDPLIRSPTPTYPTGTANPMPQMLVAAEENQYGHQPSMSYPTALRGPVIWTNHDPYH